MDMNVYRNKFSHLFNNVLVGLGWKAELLDGALFPSYSKRVGELILYTSLDGRNIYEENGKRFAKLVVAVSLSELDGIYAQIFDPHMSIDNEPVIITNTKLVKEIEDSDQIKSIVEISNFADAAFSREGVEAVIKQIAGPWKTEGQISHISALAYTGDFVTLMEYIEMFKKGKRANFFPIVKLDMIESALDIALERG